MAETVDADKGSGDYNNMDGAKYLFVTKNKQKFKSQVPGKILRRAEREMMRKINLISSFSSIITGSKIGVGKKAKKNPVTSPQRRCGCKEEIMYEENSLFSDFIGIHHC